MVEKHGPAWSEARHIVTNGPFLLDDWQPNRSLASSRNPGYRGRFGGNVGRIELSLPYDEDVDLELYEADRLDVTGVPSSKFDEVRRRHAAEYRTGPSAALFFIRFDVTHPPFSDVHVRRAFALAIDRDTLANRVMTGRGLPATGGFVPPGIPGYSAGIGLAYDPERARRELAEAGYPSGLNFPQVDLLSVSLPAMVRVVEYMKEQWQANLGVDINRRISNSSWTDSEVNELFSRGQLAMVAGGWLADYPDADTFLRTFVATLTIWRNATFAQLLESASRVGKQSERIKLYQAADHILIEEAPIIPLWYARDHMLVKPWISHYRLSPMRSWHWKDVVIEPH
jgi:oligopeptide transport system substrate-binding protein